MSALAFELSMPGRGSWNRGWSGEGRKYVLIRNLGRRREARERAAEVARESPYRYYWSDGWAACVAVREVDSREAARLRRRSAGFCGYDWMVDSILRHGAIYASDEAAAAGSAL